MTRRRRFLLTAVRLSFDSAFTVEGPAGTVTGTRVLDTQADPTPEWSGLSSSGWCSLNTATDIGAMDSALLRYVATISSATGAYSDSGLSYGQLQLAPGLDPASFSNYWFSAFYLSEGVEPLGPATMTLTPPVAVNFVGTQHTVTADVDNSAGQPVSGVDVDFTVAGSTSTTPSCTTDASGECSVTYNGPSLPGADLIVGCADSDGNGARDPANHAAKQPRPGCSPSSTPGQVTGGAHVLNPSDGEEVAFGFNAKSDSKGLKGNCTVVDKAPARNVKIKCLTVDSLVQSGNSATFFGQADMNGVTTTYRIDVTDNGEPGRNRDTFTIQTGTGYSAGGLLDNGNIQVHN